jgi:hypothetical protein
MTQARKLGRAALAVTLLGAALGSSTALAQQSPEADPAKGQANVAQPTAATAQVVEATFKVQKVDKKDRTLTLKDPSGGVLEVKAGPNVDLDKVRTGETLNVSYFSEVALSITKAGEGAPKFAAQALERGGVTARQATVTAQITSIDREHDTVVVRGPAGQSHTLRIDDPQLRSQLAEVKPGDNLQITYTQAVAVAAEPSKASKGPSKAPSKAAPPKAPPSK